MTAARLSPAASLLRSSKLFALPPAIALPNPEPSSEPVPRSDTATTLYPTRAAIETPLTSLGRGDWGFKRQLPLKSTTKSGNPTVRLNKGIDTAEHIADFDSAADHVLTLKKFQELNIPLQHPNSDRANVHYGVFRKRCDNTTNASAGAPINVQHTGVWPSLSPSELQKQLPAAIQSQIQANATDEAPGSTGSTSTPAARLQRWRFDGPSLVQMSGLEFDQWMKTLDTSKRQAFKERVKQDLLARKRRTHSARAQDEGTVGQIDASTLEVSEQEVDEQMRRLRQQPREFGRLIAAFLDLPDGPSGESMRLRQDIWDYGRNTLASTSYRNTGPPRMHPSAGLSYIHNTRSAQNHSVFGPQLDNLPVVARQIKTRVRASKNVATLGVAGFVVEKQSHKGTMDNTNAPPFEPQPGGQKMVVRPGSAEFDEKGALKLAVKDVSDYVVEDERAVHVHMARDTGSASARSLPGTRGSRVMQPLINANKRSSYSASTESEEDLDFLGGTR